MLRRFFTALKEVVRRYFVAGILLFAPLGITAWAIGSIIVWLDNLLLPRLIKLVVPGIDEPPPVPLIGMLFTFLVILLMGVVARHLFGGEFLRIGERLLARIPVARSIYRGVKQLVEAIFLPGHQAGRFNRVVMIEYPRKGIYALAFTTGTARGVVQDLTEDTMINCFLPTTPNPTSGYYLLVPEGDIIEVDITVEDAFKLVMSAGLVAPDAHPNPDSDSAEEAVSAPALPIRN